MRTPGSRNKFLPLTCLLAAAAAVALGVVACSPHYVRSAPLDLSKIIQPGPSLSRNVILISIDGLRPDAIEQFGAPTLQRLMNEGTYSLKARTILPSSTLPSHTSMLSGEPPDQHHVLWNNVVNA